MGKARRATLPRRFWAKVDKSGECWEWTAATAMGYGVINLEGAVTYAHRLSWEMHYGPIPDGLQILHHCDNRRCVRPDHLFLGTLNDNMADMVAKGRHADARGEANARSKLTRRDVLAIRQEYAQGQITQSSLAERYGVAISTIGHLLTGRSWRHVAGGGECVFR